MIAQFDPNINVAITESAANKIESLLKKGELLRLYITGGGCSGFQYMFDIVRKKEDDDIFLESNHLIIDPLSYQYVENAEIDYVNNLSGSKFLVNNPQAKITCGCGQSFMV